MYNTFIVLLFLMVMAPVASDPVLDFSEVDRHARKLNKSATFEQTAERLTEPFESEKEKARAIFIWLTDNIDYDIAKFKRQQSNPKREKIFANSRAELEEIRRKKHHDMAKKAFRTGKGVCEDYSYLFQFMCEHIGIEAEFIPGYGRFSPSTINKMHRGSNHAWNAVKLEGNWYLLDATWAAGSTDIRAGKFKKEYKEGLFMTPPERFILSHFPDDPAWQLLDDPVQLDEFIRLPYGFPELSNPMVLDHFPKEGIVKKSRNPVTVGLEVAPNNWDFVLIMNRSTTRIPAVKENGRVYFDIAAEQLKRGELTIATIQAQKLKPLISFLVM